MKTDNYSNIEIIVQCLKDNKIRYVVISPGGTNIPFVKAIQDDSFFKCFSIVDERSAIYFAIGLYLETGETIATSCTSAQATRNYIPGLTEAYYKHVPILAITMQKHPRFTYQEYMQAPDQASLPKDAVKKSFSLPYISDKNDLLHSIRIVNESVIELTKNVKGPVQLCVPWLDFPLADYDINYRKIEQISTENIPSLDLQGKRYLICIGEHLPFDTKTYNEIESFCERTNTVVYTNHLSNYKGKYSINGNLILSTIDFDSFQKELLPDVLITIGGQTGDYPFYNLFSKIEIQNIEHWRIDQGGRVVDTYDKLTKIILSSESDFFKMNRLSGEKNHEYFNKWRDFYNSKNTKIELPLSNPFCAQKFTNFIPEFSNVHFAILNSLRTWNLFEFRNRVNCFSNVAAFGIDGGLSTLIGQSVLSDKLNFIIIGDLAFYYDMNALAIKHISNNVRILLINNGGGFEFKINGDPNVNKTINRFIAAGNYFKSAENWANTCDFEYIPVHHKNDLENNIEKFVNYNEKSILMEVFVTDIDERDAYHTLLDVNKKTTLKKIIKKIIK